MGGETTVRCCTKGAVSLMCRKGEGYQRPFYKLKGLLRLRQARCTVRLEKTALVNSVCSRLIKSRNL